MAHFFGFIETVKWLYITEDLHSGVWCVWMGFLAYWLNTFLPFDIKSYKKRQRGRKDECGDTLRGERRDNSQVSEVWLSRVRNSHGCDQWEASISIIDQSEARDWQLWLCDQVHPSHRHNTLRWEYLEMFGNTGNWYSVYTLLFLASRFTCSGPCIPRIRFKTD